ncbi:MAG: tetratricopeptide repeat protein [Proteobacteria bacterium]|nr:tetratricopeptide repeat protein [Pseudomonadota bacterium]
MRVRTKVFVGSICLAVTAGLLLNPAGLATIAAAAPDRARAKHWLTLGFKAKDLRRKVAYYQRAVAADPTLAVAWNNLAVARGRWGNYPQAVIDYGRALRLNPRYALAYANRGYAYRQMRMFRLAAADYSRAIRLKPRNYGFWRGRGQVYAAWGKYKPAVRDYTKSLALAPMVATYRFRASAYVRLGRQDLAKADYERARQMVRGPRPIKPQPAPGKAVFRFETQEASVKRGADYLRRFAVYIDDKLAGTTPWRKRTALKTVSLPLTPGTHRVLVQEMTRQDGGMRPGRTPFNKRYRDQKFTIVVKADTEVTMRIMLFRNGEVVNPPKIMVRKLK